MSSADPIVIVGRGCVLPGAEDVPALADLVMSGRVTVDDGTDADFNLSPGTFERAFLVRKPKVAGADQTWTGKAGFIRGFEARFNANGLRVDVGTIRRVDAGARWLIEAGRQALREAGMSPDALSRLRSHAIIGNLSYPSPGHVRAGERVWWERQSEDVRRRLVPSGLDDVEWLDRFSSTQPVTVMARALGCEGGYLALDAACASSLYAMDIAAAHLRDGRADAVLVGGLNRADPLFLQLGFAALGALSQSGQSRPFSTEADGLLPAQGAALLLLRRLSDALRDGQRVLAVVAGIGLSNDGAAGGLLAPDRGGQIAAYRRAYEQAGVDPATVSYLECHATGTPVGDRTELEGIRAFFPNANRLPLGSLKANVGHLITAAGAAGVLKVLGGFDRAMMPPMPYAPGTALAPVFAERLCPWPTRSHQNVGISAFGFGGNNAHLILQSYDRDLHRHASRKPLPSQGPAVPTLLPLRVVDLALQVGPNETDAVVHAMTHKQTLTNRRLRSLTVDAHGTRTTPRDLGEALGQQLLALNACRAAVARHSLHPDRTGLFVAMACDSEITRASGRWRMAGRLGTSPPNTREAMKDTWAPALSAARVTGTMPNIVANRVSLALDLRGPAFTVSAEECGGLAALELAEQAIRAGQLDQAIVAAVDLCDEPVHARADARAWDPADVAVAILVTRGDASDAHLRLEPVTTAQIDKAARTSVAASLFGHCHAAGGLLEVALGLLRGSSEPIVIEDRHGFRKTAHITNRFIFIPRAPRQPEIPVVLSARLPDVALSATVSTPAAPMEVCMPSAPRLPPTDERHPQESSRVTIPQQIPALTPSLSPTGPTDETVTLAAFLAHRQTLDTLRWGHQQFLRAAGIHLPPSQPFPDADAVILAATTAHAQFTRSLAAGAARGLSDLGYPVEAPPLSSGMAVLAANLSMRDLESTLRWSVGTTPIRDLPHEPLPDLPAPPPAPPPAVLWDRSDLEVLAGGRISQVFGSAFADQDVFVVQTRMPMSPLLLSDRVLRIDANAHSMETGSICSETDAGNHTWCFHHGRMPPGLMMEAGQADLLLISYLGIDRLNRGNRRYRLLGCEATYKGPLPQAHETLTFDIRADGHANAGDVRLFFFSSDCRVGDDVRLSVRHGQAGFFTEAELAASEGVLWKPEDDPPAAETPWSPPLVRRQNTPLTAADLASFRAGDAFTCFGPGFDLLASHTRTPNIPSGRMALFEEVSALECAGGPWGRGYARAEYTVHSDDWFFAGHFKNDPCMPGTLMFDAAIQLLSVYMVAHGLTLQKDGWRFEPVPGHTVKLQARGQVLPTSKRVTYEIFVREVENGSFPTVTADILGTVDGLKAFHCRAFKLRLVPDWPAATPARRLSDGASSGRVPGDARALLDCALGRPSDAFGPMYSGKDGAIRVPRLPAPPYLCMSQIEKMPEVAPASMIAPCSVTAVFDIDPHAWYLEANAFPVMPFAILLEAALQPCGWLASYVGCAAERAEDVAFRNLDGTGTILGEVDPSSGPLKTDVTLNKLVRAGETTIVGFAVQCRQGDRPVYKLDTVFGFFSPSALQAQVGLPTSDADVERQLFDAPVNADIRLDGSSRGNGPAVASAPLLLPDRLTGLWPRGGRAGLGAARSERRVDPRDWTFKAHFFQDPVQPGSIGIEGMLQTLQAYMLHSGLCERVPGGRFQAIATGISHGWKYRGQVLPTHQRVVITISVKSIDEGINDLTVLADGALWVDGTRIYEARDLGMRIVTDGTVFDPKANPWVKDHAPTYVVPTAPMMWMVDELARVTMSRHPGRRVVGVRNAQVERWLVCDEPRRLAFDIGAIKDGQVRACLRAWRNASDPRLSRFETIATADLIVGERFGHASEDWQWSPRGVPVSDPYGVGGLFHGPAFQFIRSLEGTDREAWATLESSPELAPTGALGGGLLDALLHAIPHDRPDRWSDKIPASRTLIPHRLVRLDLFDATPALGASVRVHAECVACLPGPEPDRPILRSRVRASSGDRPWIEFEIDEVALPTGALGAFTGDKRRQFACEDRFIEGMRLSTALSDGAELSDEDVATTDWLPGTVEHTYGLPPSSADRTVAIAVKEVAAHHWRLHPRLVDWDPATGLARSRHRPLSALRLVVRREGARVRVMDGQRHWEWARFIKHWEKFASAPRWPGTDVFRSLLTQFVDEFIVDDPDALAKLHGQPCLFLASHQAQVESMLLSLILPVVQGCAVTVIASAQMANEWLATFPALLFSYPGLPPHETSTYVDQGEPGVMAEILSRLGERMLREGRSTLVHVEGLQGSCAGAPVQKLSSLFIEAALKHQIPIVPVRADGGLPDRLVAARKLSFPWGFARQTFFVGKPVLPAELLPMDLLERRRHVANAINSAGSPEFDLDHPSLPEMNLPFSTDVDRWRLKHGAELGESTIAVALRHHGQDDDLRALLDHGTLPPGAGADSAEAQWWKTFAGRVRPRASAEAPPPFIAPGVASQRMWWSGKGAGTLRATHSSSGSRLGTHVIETLLGAFAGTIRAPEDLDLRELQGVVFVGNHQTEFEHLFFPIAMSALLKQPVIAVGPRLSYERRLVQLLHHLLRDRDLDALPLAAAVRAIAALPANQRLEYCFDGVSRGSLSILLDADPIPQGTDTTPVQGLSEHWSDLAARVGKRIVPVRFSGGVAESLQPYFGWILPEAWRPQSCVLGDPWTPRDNERETKAFSDGIVSRINGLSRIPTEPSRLASTVLERARAWRGTHRCLSPMAIIAALLLEDPGTPPALAAALRDGTLVEELSSEEKVWLSDLLIFFTTPLAPPERQRPA